MNPGGLIDRACDWMWRVDAPEVDFEDFLKRCQSGDILLFSGNGGWWTQFWTWSHFTHVSVVFRSPKTDKTYQWQSTTSSDEVDCLTHEFNRRGTQALDLRASVYHYAQKWSNLICWRPLMHRTSEDDFFSRRIPPQSLKCVNDGFVRVMEGTEGWGFQHDVRDMMGGRDFFLQYLPYPIGRKPDFHRKIFCAPLAAWTLEEAGVLRQNFPVGNYSPASFHDKTDQMFLNDEWGYGPTYKIKFTPARRSVLV